MKMLTYNEFYTVPDFIHSNADNGLNYQGGVTLATTIQANGPHANMSRGLHSLKPLERIVYVLERLV